MYNHYELIFRICLLWCIFISVVSYNFLALILLSTSLYSTFDCFLISIIFFLAVFFNLASSRSKYYTNCSKFYCRYSRSNLIYSSLFIILILSLSKSALLCASFSMKSTDWNSPETSTNRYLFDHLKHICRSVHLFFTNYINSYHETRAIAFTVI
jgi:hypothetical protein